MASLMCYLMSTRLLVLLPLFLVIATNCFSSMQPHCNDDESSALLQFKESFERNVNACSDPFAYPKFASWKHEGVDKDCCSWDGVECNNDTGHVIGLDLSNSCLYGSLVSNSSLFHLVHLQKLNLAFNNFNFSQIPSGFSRLSRLTYLSLSFSYFSGQIPSKFSELSKLSYLDLSYNYMLHLGNLKGLVQNLTSLQDLYLNYVQISSPVPEILSNLSCLTTLHFIGCELHGEFPVGIFKLPKLEDLSMGGNQELMGYFPEFHSSSPLKILQLWGTSFSGKLPASIGYLDSLNELWIGSCTFSGRIPPSMGNLTQLTTLELSNNSFMGQIPPSLSNLMSLNYFYLSYCQLSGSIPSSFGNLTQLLVLDLSNTFIRSSNPSSMSWLGKLSKLTLLSIHGYNLTMEIPPSLENLTQLSFLGMSSCQLTGQIPFWLANLTQLIDLHLSFNKLQGQIPTSMFELEILQILNLYSNNLTGTVSLDMFLKLKSLTSLLLSLNNISFLTKTNVNATQNKFDVLALASCNLRHFPDFLRNQDQLKGLDLSNNNIHGQIPKWVWNISKDTLIYVNFSHNFLTGFDQHLVNFPWPQLQILDLSSNKLQESPQIPPPSTLIYLVANNMLQGEISPLICNLSSLYSLDLSNNQFRGILPHCLVNLSGSLNILNLRGNKFHGMIPQLAMKGSTLRMIDLSQNQFEGVVPRALSNCRMLEILNLGSNQLNDVFPSWLGTLPELRVLILRHNGFYGVVGSPTTIFASPKLRIVDLSANKFIGSLPFEYFQNLMSVKKVDANNFTHIRAFTIIPLAGFTVPEDYPYSMTITNKGKETVYLKIIEVFAVIDLSSNEFNGKIPQFIGNLNGFQLLNLSHNNLTGHIPLSLGNLTTLESLDLSQNKLSGWIPWQLTQLTFLESFNVSHNQLTGPIPHGKQFDTFDNSSFDGNLGLCGNPLSKKCENPEPTPLPTSSFEEDQDSWFHIEFDWKIILMGYGSGLVIGVVVGNIVAEKIRTWKRQHKRGRSRITLFTIY
uniref:Leucine-rich repeat-containing N-terminal plant-type domain-containing protein n=1 Tax=Fagus sylvatica TaxID=28930 RepID=A0A2N9HAT7_FAGSY